MYNVISCACNSLADFHRWSTDPCDQHFVLGIGGLRELAGGDQFFPCESRMDVALVAAQLAVSEHAFVVGIRRQIEIGVVGGSLPRDVEAPEQIIHQRE